MGPEAAETWLYRMTLKIQWTEYGKNWDVLNEMDIKRTLVLGRRKKIVRLGYDSLVPREVYKVNQRET